MVEVAGFGKVAEWFKAPVLKTGVPARVPWVRIPPLPPAYLKSLIFFLFFPAAPGLTPGRKNRGRGAPNLASPFSSVLPLVLRDRAGSSRSRSGGQHPRD